MRTLSLTSPHQKGHDVELAQKLLGKNQYGAFLSGTADGEYGPETAAAVRRAKWALGFANGDVNGSCGDRLLNLLSGKKSLPVLYALRRKRRLAPKPHTLSQAALDSATQKLGTKESPADSNRVLFSNWYGLVGPWCAMFVSWNYVQAGSKVFKAGQHYSYCPYILADAKAGRNGLSITKDPKPGDIVLYCWNGSGVPEHTGLFEKWTVHGKSFTAVEGNTAVGNDANGGEVMRRDRDASLVVAFVQVAG